MLCDSSTHIAKGIAKPHQGTSTEIIDQDLIRHLLLCPALVALDAFLRVRALPTNDISHQMSVAASLTKQHQSTQQYLKAAVGHWCAGSPRDCRHGTQQSPPKDTVPLASEAGARGDAA